VLAVLLVVAATLSSPASATTSAPLLLRHNLDDAQQVVLVRGVSWSSSKAVLEAYELVDGEWRRVLGPVPARVGRTGFSLDHHEGDGSSPAGVFTLTEAFGLRTDPGSRLPYRSVTADDWWVSDVASPLYNTWQTGPPAGRWNPLAGERLATHGPTAYGHAIVIDYNRTPVVAGAGSAIFLHIGGTAATSGCVAVARTQMVSLLHWLDPAKHPRIAMGPEAWLLDPGLLSGTVRPFARGDDVRVLQRALASSGHSVAVDGVYGAKTVALMRTLQRAAGLPATGIVGPATARMLGIWPT
jgi:L,D-peptidoglycan transpeptidase YkuD (ErfK/YbiS/YcfS/YnhG family)